MFLRVSYHLMENKFLGDPKCRQALNAPLGGAHSKVHLQPGVWAQLCPEEGPGDRDEDHVRLRMLPQIQELRSSCMCLLMSVMIMRESALCEGCHPRLTPLEQSLRQAEQEAQDGRILLPMLDGFLPAVEHEVVRVPIGTTASFYCTPLTTGIPDPVQLVWRHNYLTIAANTTPPSTSAEYFYTHTVHQNTSYFFIHNMTFDARGDVDCLQYINSSDGLQVIKHWELMGKFHSSKQVFAGEMTTIRTRSTRIFQASEIAFTCTTTFNCICGTRTPDFIWKVEEKFAIVPNEPPGMKEFLFEAFDSKTTDLLNPLGVLVYNTSYECRLAADPEQIRCRMTMHAYESLSLRDKPLLVQCWVQPDRTRNEWFVQKATFNNLGKKFNFSVYASS
ncbi:uncharacterized protein LOC129599840 isoform X2 [Paramacrobiotus metropolitanus]|uniref:uncharacterized protein LOC129599840 isoform X2 n=1 Tax=Paramacrobiotus metropolitanus TaxID=2943436 RepID=UPI00244567C1|nr:uncharacterized protein LOC129599840 isoform X2 [Paramacrobiotus metropolitanus]